jgi:hypothetical protein
MSRMTDLLAVGYMARHCTEPQCAKCSARARWYRRKARHSGKSRVRTNTGRK